MVDDVFTLDSDQSALTPFESKTSGKLKITDNLKKYIISILIKVYIYLDVTPTSPHRMQLLLTLQTGFSCEIVRFHIISEAPRQLPAYVDSCQLSV